VPDEIVYGGGRAQIAAPVIALPDAFSAAAERWIEAHIRGGPIEPHLIDLREALPQLYAGLVAALFSKG
jgi:hypothetical protein